jgi:hypothetical protein
MTIKSFSIKKRLLCAVWFGASGFIAAVIGLAASSALPAKDVFTSVFTLSASLIAALMGLFFGQKILSLPSTDKSWRTAARYGFIGGSLSLLLIDAGIILFLNIYNYMDCHRWFHLAAAPAVNCHEAFQGALTLSFAILAFCLIYGGWCGIIVGAIAAVLLHKLKK